MDDKPWFAAKTYGYGAGLPICWEGWAFLAGYIGVTFLGVHLANAYASGDLRSIAMMAAIVVPLAIAVLIMRKKTDGGWHWRNGSN